ncbi:MAG: DUF4190 domain-containing protein [Acidobacteriota bacterium]
MFCPKCGTQQPALDRICIKCASPLPVTGKLAPRIIQRPPQAATPIEGQNTPQSGYPNAPPPWTLPPTYQEPNATTNPVPDSSYRDSYHPGKYLGSYSPDYKPGAYHSQQPPVWQGDQNRASGRAIAALISGALGFTVCPLIGIVALVLGRQEITAIERGQSSPAGKTLAQVGFYLGAANLILVGLAVLWFAIMMATAAL